MANPSHPDGLVTLGRIVGLFGVQGWVKVLSHTRPRESILEYNPWQLYLDGVWQERKLIDGRLQGKGIVARLEGCRNRDQAAVLVGADIAVPLSQLPALAENEYYWAQLEGLRVRNQQGVELGKVAYLFETGANDVMVVQGERERLLPYISDVIKEVDLSGGIIVVDWDENL